MSHESRYGDIGKTEDVTVTLPGASKWSNVVNDEGHDTAAPTWNLPSFGLVTAFTGGVEIDGCYREDLGDLRDEALAMLAAVNAAGQLEGDNNV